MTVEHRTVAGLKAQLSKFSESFQKSLQPKKRLIKEMLYGIRSLEGCEAE